ncbi:MAG: hypothetical protein KAR54_02065 [Candidatus Pacebacteria bacterium]|nr:hypothetical protein [Candidatus Paceibacterota bacterium]
MKQYLLLTPFIFLYFGIFGVANSATLYLLPEYRNMDIGQEFFVDVKVDTNEDFINAVQSTIDFPNNIEIIGSDKQNSVFNFWIEDPEISESKDQIIFIGGTAKGVSGESIQILRIKCKSIGTGTGTIEMTESVVTANDGKGTNILSDIKNTSINVGTNIQVSEDISIAEAPRIIPQIIERKAVIAKDLPAKPELKVSLYPDQETWYNHQGETTILWEITDDVIKTAISVDNNPNSEPDTSEDALYTGKNIGVLEEGIHYIHVQFKNNKGWGEVAHYKVFIDTTSPLAFETEISSFTSTNPSPEITFKSGDALSGYSHALIYVDEKEPIFTKDNFLTLPIQKLGGHSLTVRVFDFAGNSIEDDLNYEILPLETPTISFFTEKISQGEMIFISGISIPETIVILKIQKDEQIISEEIIETDETGKWELALDKLLAKGNYLLSVKARDNRGAISLDSETINVKITAQIIFSLGLMDLGWFEIFIIIMLTLSIGGTIGVWYYLSQKEVKEAYKIIANRDVKKMSKLLDEDVSFIEKEFKKEKKISSEGKVSIESYIKKIKDNIKKMDKYLGIEINKSK